MQQFVVQGKATRRPFEEVAQTMVPQFVEEPVLVPKAMVQENAIQQPVDVVEPLAVPPMKQAGYNSIIADVLWVSDDNDYEHQRQPRTEEKEVLMLLDGVEINMMSSGGSKYVGIVEEVRRAIKNLHLSMGHFGTGSMVRMLNASHASSLAKKAAKLFRCEHCASIARSCFSKLLNSAAVAGR